jgi:hypothetical protein
LGGAFVWDQLRRREPVTAVADPQIFFAAIDGATERIQLGPMVTPLTRRRPAKVAHEPVDPRPAERRPPLAGVGLGSDAKGRDEDALLRGEGKWSWRRHDEYDLKEDKPR